jgi:hypothetical protein
VRPLPVIALLDSTLLIEIQASITLVLIVLNTAIGDG